MKKLMLCLCLCVFLAAAAHGEKLALKFTLGGTYLLGGDYNKGIQGWRDYERSVLGANETFVDEMKTLHLSYQFAAELLYPFNSSLAAGLEVGYLGASVTSHLERTWHNYKWTTNPHLSAVPVILNLHFLKSLGDKLSLHLLAGAGVFISKLTFDYIIDDSAYPYSGTWRPEGKTVFGAKAGAGIEYGLSDKFVLTFDVTGRFAEVKGFTGPWEGIYSGVPKTGKGSLYIYEINGTYSYIVIYASTPGGSSVSNPRLAKLSLSGVSVQTGVKINL